LRITLFSFFEGNEVMCFKCQSVSSELDNYLITMKLPGSYNSMY